MLELDMSSIQGVTKFLFFCGASVALGCDDGAGKPEARSGCDTLRYPDGDGDGFGDSTTGERRCAAEGWVTQGGDCDDGDARIHPGAVEICDLDAVDEDCDGAANDSTAQDAEYWYLDTDGDGFGAGAPSSLGCAPSEGEVSNDDDCDDTNSTVHPDANERCDGVDSNCNGEVDDGPIADGVDAGADLFYMDSDGDGWGTESSYVYACTAMPDYVMQRGDCDDADNTSHPGAVEACDGIDQDCDGFLDNQCGTTTLVGEADWILPYPVDEEDVDADTTILVASDLTNDGRDDLLVAYGDRYMQLHQGPISGTSEALWTLDFLGDAFAMGHGITVDADFNSDGVPDMAVPVLSYGSAYPPSIMVFYGPFDEAPDWDSPDHSLELASAFSFGGATGLTAADFTGDGAVDLAFETQGAGIDIHVWDNVGATDSVFLGSSATLSWSGSVEEVDVASFGVGPTKGDFNGDGHADLVHVGPDVDALSLRLGPLTSAPEELPDVVLEDVSSEAPWSFTHDLCIADFDGDGRDEVGVGARPADETMAFESEGVELWVFEPLESADEVLFKVTQEEEDAQLAIYTCTDVDGDGQVDVLMQRPLMMNGVGYEVGAVHLFFGNIAGSRDEDSADRVFMSESTNTFFGTLVTTGDPDDDGYSDLIIAGRFSDVAAFGSESWLSEWWGGD